MIHATRADQLTTDIFVERHLSVREPVLVRGVGTDWSWPTEWDFQTLATRFANLRVPLYDALFNLYGLSTFDAFIANHTGPGTGRRTPADPRDTEAHTNATIPYLRWYSRQSEDRLPWADEAFAQLADCWSVPSWLPDSGYLFPRLHGRADPRIDPFPAKGMFICGARGRTRLHIDPWASDAYLCQTIGAKRVVLFRPEASRLLGRPASPVDLVDLDDPDDQTYPQWRKAVIELDVVLHPGDCLYIPAGWPHAATALTDSMSLTWNFVHETNAASFERYLAEGGATEPAVRYFMRPDLR